MLKLTTRLLDLPYTHECAEHFYGNQAGDVLVIETADRELINGLRHIDSRYSFVWTGRALRRANDLEAYRFRSA